MQNKNPSSQLWKRALAVCALLTLAVVVSSCGGGGGSNNKTLTDKLRPYQAGSMIDVADDATSTNPAHGCSYGFHAQRYGEIGLVTALHCTNATIDSSGNFAVSGGERIWQTYADDANEIARVGLKPAVLDGWSDDECRQAIDDLGRSDLRWCIRADAVFAPFVHQSDLDDDTYQAGAVASLPLSVEENKLGPVDEDHPSSYIGYSRDPVYGEYLYKLGSTTGKTVGYLTGTGDPVNIPLSLHEYEEDVVLLGVYPAQSSNTATFADHGDSGGIVFQSFNGGGSDGDFTLVGTVSAGTRDGLLLIEPLGDILDELDVEIEFPAVMALGHPNGREN